MTDDSLLWGGGRQTRLIDAVYATVPPTDCTGACAAKECTVTHFAPAEAARLPVAPPLRTVLNQSDPCPFLTPGGRCSVFELRPMICRLYAAAEEGYLVCPHGCRPTGRGLSHAETLAAMNAVQVLGTPGWDRVPDPEGLHERLLRAYRHPEVEPIVSRVQRGLGGGPDNEFVHALGRDAVADVPWEQQERRIVARARDAAEWHATHPTMGSAAQMIADRLAGVGFETAEAAAQAFMDVTEDLLEQAKLVRRTPGAAHTPQAPRRRPSRKRRKK